jgi:YVTN family beta-propeller protein
MSIIQKITLLSLVLFLSIVGFSQVIVVDTIVVGNYPRGIGVNPLTNRIYVANSGSDNVSIIDGLGDSVVATIGVGVHPYGIGVNSQTNRIYVANWYSNDVSVIDGSGDSVVATIGVGNEPWGVGVNPQTNRIYVSCPYDGTIWVLMDLTGGVEDSSHNSRVLSFTAYPNPFSNRTEFNFYLEDDNRKGDVNFSIYDVGGRLVKSFSLVNKHSSSINISWDGRDNSGKKLSSGVYFGVLKAGDNKFSKRKMIMIK